MLDELALPEIWEVPGWSDTEPDRRRAVVDYKKRIRGELEERSATAWRERVVLECPERPYLAASPAPLSAAGIMLGVDDMGAVWSADAWARLRIGITSASEPGVKQGEKNCPLCNQRSSGLGHLAGSCPKLIQERASYLRAITSARKTELATAGEGGWAMSVFSVVADPHDLSANVRFGAAIESRLRMGGEKKEAEVASAD